MTIWVADGVIHLEGRCGAEDADTLLVALQDSLMPIDASGATRVHLAVAQVLLALRPPLHAPPTNPILARALWPQWHML